MSETTRKRESECKRETSSERDQRETTSVRETKSIVRQTTTQCGGETSQRVREPSRKLARGGVARV